MVFLTCKCCPIARTTWTEASRFSQCTPTGSWENGQGKGGGGGYSKNHIASVPWPVKNMNYLCITSTTAFVPLGMFPENKYALANSPCTRAAYSLVYFAHTHTHTNTMYGFTALVISFMLCSKPTLYLRPLVVDLSSWAKYGRPYCAWSAPSITVLIASVDAAACALLKWYMPRSSLTYKFKQHHKLVSHIRHGTACVTWQNVRQLT